MRCRLDAEPPLPGCVQVAPLWYLAQLAFNMSLAHTSVTSNTILSSTAALFAFGLAVLLLGEAFALRKLGFILLLIAGEHGRVLGCVGREQTGVG